MKTIKYINNYWFFNLFLLISIFLCSCKTSKIVTKENTSVAELPGLYIDTATFHHWALKNEKIMFRFTFEHKSIKLTGWSMYDTINFDTSETLNLIASDKLFKIEASHLYLGNLRFSQADITFVDSAARSYHLKYILFKPIESPVYPGHIAYKIYVSNVNSVYAYTKKPQEKSNKRQFILVAYITGDFKPNSTTSKYLDPSPPAHL